MELRQIVLNRSSGEDDSAGSREQLEGLRDFGFSRLESMTYVPSVVSTISSPSEAKPDLRRKSPVQSGVELL